MCDPVSAVHLAVESISILISVTSTLKSIAETIKNARKEIEELVQHIETMKNLFQLIHIISLELQKTNFKGLELAIDERKCNQTLNTLQELASDIAKSKSNLGMLGKLSWATKKETAKALCQQMTKEEREITNAIMLISAASTFRTQGEVKSITDNLENMTKLQDAFANISIDPHKSRLNIADGSAAAPKLRTWLGQVVLIRIPEDYAALRKQYHDAAFLAQWNLVFDLLEKARVTYNESWVNATRPKPIQHAHQMSMWTVLHQAAYNRAPVEVVKKLIELGASRTLRSRWSAYSYLDMTAVELAREFQAVELYEVLSPVIYHPLPHATLNALERLFHELIERDLGERVHAERMYLPVLEPLTEHESVPVWFPVAYGSEIAGYAYQLDGRALVVKSFRIRKDMVEATYRISEKDGIVDIDKALVTSG